MNLEQNNSRSKEVLSAYLRQGLHEVGSTLYGPGTHAQHPEYGMIGTKPPSMIVEGLRGEAQAEHSRDDPASSQLDAKLKEVRDIAPPESAREDRHVERD